MRISDTYAVADHLAVRVVLCGVNAEKGLAGFQITKQVEGDRLAELLAIAGGVVFPELFKEGCI